MTRTVAVLSTALMLLAALLSQVLMPTQLASERNHVQLQQMVPQAFGAWRAQSDPDAVIASPELDARLAQVYAQVLGRTYVNAQGQRIMLSIAYSTDQRENSGRQSHRPEICYPAQGYVISDHQSGSLALPGHSLPVLRMVATQGNRIEPLTYWMTLDGLAENSMRKMKWDQVKGGLLQGVVQDGMVFRVSSLDADPVHAYQLETGFVQQLFAAMPRASRRIFFGVNA
jgi:EpsI family protein